MSCSDNPTSIEQVNELETVTLKLEGFKSKCCVGIVAYSLNELEGVTKYEPDVENQQIKIWYDASKISEEEIITAINKTPYKVMD